MSTRIFVNAAIKKALCREAGSDRGWLAKVRPWWGHDYHFHVRISCPADSAHCEPQQPPVPGATAADMSSIIGSRKANLHPNLSGGAKHLLTMSNLPPECRKVLMAP